MGTRQSLWSTLKWLWIAEPLVFMLMATAAIAVTAAATVTFLSRHDGMLWVQVRRRAQQLRFYVGTLRRGRVSLQHFLEAVTRAYNACGFQRQLSPSEMQQLARHAGFQPAAAAALLRCLQTAAASGGGGASGSGGPSLHQQLQRISMVGVPAWRFSYFMWWLQSHLVTLQLLRAEWEHESPRLISGFDVTRVTATAMLFRRSKGTCMVRLGMEVGGVIVSLRPDKARLPEEQRTPESYFSSVSAAQLAGAAYEMAQEHHLPEHQKRREGAVVHVYVPNASLRSHGGLLGCLRRMRHTKHFMDASVGECLPTGKAFERLVPPPRPSVSQVYAMREQLLVRAMQEAQQQEQQQEQRGQPGSDTMAPSQQLSPQQELRRRHGDQQQAQQPELSADPQRELQWRLLQARAQAMAAQSGLDM